MNCTDNVMVTISNALRQMPNLAKLHLISANFSRQQLATLADGLNNNQALHSICIHQTDTGIVSEAPDDLITAIMGIPTLQHFSLCNISLRDEAIAIIPRALKKDHPLKSLHLANCTASADALSLLASALAVTRYLTQLKLEVNKSAILPFDTLSWAISSNPYCALETIDFEYRATESSQKIAEKIYALKQLIAKKQRELKGPQTNLPHPTSSNHNHARRYGTFHAKPPKETPSRGKSSDSKVAGSALTPFDHIEEPKAESERSGWFGF